MNLFDWIILYLALSIIIILLTDVYFHNCAFTTAVKKIIAFFEIQDYIVLGILLKNWLKYSNGGKGLSMGILRLSGTKAIEDLKPWSRDL